MHGRRLQRRWVPQLEPHAGGSLLRPSLAWCRLFSSFSHLLLFSTALLHAYWPRQCCRYRSLDRSTSVRGRGRQQLGLGARTLSNHATQPYTTVRFIGSTLVLSPGFGGTAVRRQCNIASWHSPKMRWRTDGKPDSPVRVPSAPDRPRIGKTRRGPPPYPPFPSPPPRHPHQAPSSDL